MTQHIYYAGIGSRETPDHVCQLMYKIAQALGQHSEQNTRFILRSGGAQGADTCFEQGCDSVEGLKQVFLPWRQFNNHPSHEFNVPDRAFTIAEQTFKGKVQWDELKDSTKKMMARNTQQVLGANCSNPSSFVVCWTPDGCEDDTSRSLQTGGTGQAISVASITDVPVFNLYNPAALDRLYSHVAELIGHELKLGGSVNDE